MIMRTGLLWMIVSLSYRLGVLNERNFPGDRDWPLEGEGQYWFALLVLCVAASVISAPDDNGGKCGSKTAGH